MKSVSPQVAQNGNGNGNGNGHRKAKGKDVVSQVAHPEPKDGGKLIVLTAPLTEAIDHAGYFIQMAMASLPIWMEGVINKKYPKWRDLEKNEDSSARYMPAGVRLVETSLLREYKPDDIVACFPEDLHKFVGPTNARSCRVDPQSAGRNICCRCLYFNLWLVADADQFPLFARAV